MAHVQLASDVRERHHDAIRPAARVRDGVEQPSSLPFSVPLLLYLLRLISAGDLGHDAPSRKTPAPLRLKGRSGAPRYHLCPGRSSRHSRLITLSRAFPRGPRSAQPPDPPLRGNVRSAHPGELAPDLPSLLDDGPTPPRPRLPGLPGLC